MGVHLLVDRSNTTVRARCGVSVAIRSGNTKLPDDFTAWGSDVTCSACTDEPSRE